MSSLRPGVIKQQKPKPSSIVLACLDEVWTGNEKVDFEKKAKEDEEKRKKKEEEKRLKEEAREKKRKQEEKQRKLDEKKRKLDAKKRTYYCTNVSSHLDEVTNLTLKVLVATSDALGHF